MALTTVTVGYGGSRIPGKDDQWSLDTTVLHAFYAQVPALSRRIRGQFDAAAIDMRYVYWFVRSFL